MSDIPLPTYADVIAAAARIEPLARRTPVQTSRTLDEWLGGRLFLKCENFQRAGAFKFRGAVNAISKLGEAERKRGVLAYSSGNHAQAISLAGRLLGAAVTVVMPQDAPAAKRRATEGYGGRVVSYDPATEDRQEVAQRLAAETNPVVIPPYDHADVIAGQGTATKELIEEADRSTFCSCAAAGVACSRGRPWRRGRSVRSQGHRGRARGRRRRHAVLQDGGASDGEEPRTIADGARTPSLGRLTFPLVRANVDDMVTVPDDALVHTMRFLWERMKLVVEPTGALGLAAALRGRVKVAGKRVGVILSGGNVDLVAALELFRALPPD